MSEIEVRFNGGLEGHLVSRQVSIRNVCVLIVSRIRRIIRAITSAISSVRSITNRVVQGRYTSSSTRRGTSHRSRKRVPVNLVLVRVRGWLVWCAGISFSLFLSLVL